MYPWTIIIPKFCSKKLWITHFIPILTLLKIYIKLRQVKRKKLSIESIFLQNFKKKFFYSQPKRKAKVKVHLKHQELDEFSIKIISAMMIKAKYT